MFSLNEQKTQLTETDADGNVVAVHDLWLTKQKKVELAFNVEGAIASIAQIEARLAHEKIQLSDLQAKLATAEVVLAAANSLQSGESE